MTTASNVVSRWTGTQVTRLLKTTREEAHSPLRTHELRQGACRRESQDRRKVARLTSDRRQGPMERRLKAGA